MMDLKRVGVFCARKNWIIIGGRNGMTIKEESTIYKMNCLKKTTKMKSYMCQTLSKSIRNLSKKSSMMMCLRLFLTGHTFIPNVKY